MTLGATHWRGMPAYVLENDRLRVITTPDPGAKITSIFDKKTAYEWLVAPADRAFGPVGVGTAFTEGDMSGWDEMYPTIKPCQYPAGGPFADMLLPDHGEVWSLPWQMETTTGDALTLSVEGHALPYRLRRTLSLDDAAQLVLSYEVSNHGAHPIAALWAAHPQFTATLHTRIVLPALVTNLYNVRDTPAWGTWGLRYAWPETVDRQGKHVRLDRIAPADTGTCRKLYVPPDTPVEWAALVEEDADHWLLMQWNGSQIPYLGLWIDEGAVNSVATVALEITDGFHDSLATAMSHQRCPVIPPGGRRQWQVTLQVGSGPLPVT